ncbi:hypothetical protein TVAG_215640 [Trichomonas vaginalis G3]|uniref:Uncharacterized protein n=1 Tax=Trichomonas vaginalis (strain ATCC PRA-98 / G3) TaxID=412133 RepID=A2G1X6_TRIV3|nr:hypothetical protein TVAGG3_0527760 [Trichomonas vaginalis G3]EAX88831.1 hypothetical protein TVAG_215640 [Trichomonas vaginalis G3]KAI5518901.1 hypothetical protein TVAGG3_0527760 [Trichomonas vaginalis G3]|eukprot:XP_001301761.1 hypothetical protein [Trichomonas vaginalis G3]
MNNPNNNAGNGATGANNGNPPGPQPNYALRRAFFNALGNRNFIRSVELLPTDEATDASLIEEIQKLSSHAELFEFIEISFQLLRTASCILVFRTNNFDFNELEPPILWNDNYLVITLNIDPKHCSVAAYLYALYRRSRFEVIAVNHPAGLVIIHEVGHVNDAATNVDKLMKDVDPSKHDHDRVLAQNFAAYNQANFDARVSPFTDFIRSKVIKAIPELEPKLSQNPRILAEYYFGDLAKDLHDYITSSINLSATESGLLLDSIHVLINKRNITKFRQRLNRISSFWLKLKLRKVENVIIILECNYLILKGWNTSNHDDLLNELPKAITLPDGSVRIYSEGGFLRAYFKYYPDELRCLQFMSLPKFNYQVEPFSSDDQKASSKALLSQVMKTYRIIIRLNHQSAMQTGIDFNLEADPNISPEFTEALWTYYERFLYFTAVKFP